MVVFTEFESRLQVALPDDFGQGSLAVVAVAFRSERSMNAFYRQRSSCTLARCLALM